MCTLILLFLVIFLISLINCHQLVIGAFKYLFLAPITGFVFGSFLWLMCCIFFKGLFCRSGYTTFLTFSIIFVEYLAFKSE
jgi:hypothetical protein